MYTRIIAAFLLTLQGLTASAAPLNVEFIEAHSMVADTTLVMAIIQVESGYDAKASSPSGAIGLMQVTPGAAIDGAIYCKLPLIKPSQLFDPAVNILYGTCYLKKQLDELDSLTEALVVYNGGYRQLANLRNGKSVANETAQYVLKVTYLYNKGVL